MWVPQSQTGSPQHDVTVIGVAASGGGVRAALFSAGALFAVTECASAQGKRVEVSAVSGSALLALEVAWSEAQTDDQALKEAVTRIVGHGYWVRTRWWIAFGLGMIGLGVGWGLWASSDPSSVTKTPWVAFGLIGALILFVILFRTQGILYRKSPIRRKGKVKRTIYTATVNDFPDLASRRLLLKAFVFNATSLTDGKVASFSGSEIPCNEPVSKFAEASAAFPGVFLARRLPGIGESLFADGGIADNTGTTYFRRCELLAPQTIIAVDASVAPPAPGSIPYARLHRAMEWLPKRLVACLVAVLGIGVIGGLVATAWITTVAVATYFFAMVGVLLFCMGLFWVGVISEFRWFGRGWPITLRSASLQHLINAEACQKEFGGEFKTISLDGVMAKTQLKPLELERAIEILQKGYCLAVEALGGEKDGNTEAFLADPLSKRSSTNVPTD